MTEKLFRHKKAVPEKLSAYGFTNDGKSYHYVKTIANGDMELTVTVSGGRVSTKLIDVASNEEYVLHLVKNAAGSYIGGIRKEYEDILSDVAEKCFAPEIFKAKQTKDVIAYFRNKYGNELEHLWADAPDNAVVRRDDTRKWYAAILTVSRRKLGFDSDERVEIIDLHAKTDLIPSLVDNEKIFPGFHMIKKHWITVILDGSVNNDRLFELIDESYALGKK